MKEVIFTAEDVLSAFEEAFYNNSRIQGRYKELAKGYCDERSAYYFMLDLSKAVSATLSKLIDNPELPPNETVLWSEGVIEGFLGFTHEQALQFSSMIQDDLNRAAGLKLKAVEPPVDEERQSGLARNIKNVKSGQYEGSAIPGQIENYFLNVSDNHKLANLVFQKSVGLNPQISRIATSACCDYCKRLQYTGEYMGNNMPDDIFKRHRDCKCELIFKPSGQRKFEGVWDKQEFNSYREAVIKQREYLTRLDKMSMSERNATINKARREQRRKRYTTDELRKKQEKQSKVAKYKKYYNN